MKLTNGQSGSSDRAGNVFCQRGPKPSPMPWPAPMSIAACCSRTVRCLRAADEDVAIAVSGLRPIINWSSDRDPFVRAQPECQRIGQYQIRPT